MPARADSDPALAEMEEVDDLLYSNPVQAIGVYQKIFDKTSPEKNLKLWLRAATKLNSSYFHIGDLTQVPIILSRTLDKAAAAQDSESHAQLLIQQHAFLFSKGDFKGAQAALEQADRIARETKLPNSIAQVMMYQAREAHRQGHSDEALELLHQAMVVLKDAPHSTRYYAMMNNIAFFLYDLNGQRIEESLKIYAEITEYFDQHKLHYLGAIAYENYASFLGKTDQLEKALDSYRRSIRHSEAIQDEYGIASSNQGLGLIFQKKGQHKEALHHLRNARPIFAKFDDQSGLANIDLATAQSLLQLGLTEEALHQLLKWKPYFEQRSRPDALAEFTQVEAAIHEKMDHPVEALRAYKKLSELQASIFDSKKQELANRYYTEFEVERRNQENLKLEHQNRLQSVTIENQEKLALRTRLALAAAVVALAVLAYSFRRTQLSRRKIEGLQRYIETNVLQRFLPPELVQEILTGKSRLDDRTKTETVTVLFADLCQFTRATDRLGPETISHILNDFFINMSDVIFAERGTIDKFIGDAIMVIFGAPSPLPPEEQALAAVRCARKMQDKLLELNKAWELSEGQHFEMRIGIHQGQAVVGTFGGSRRSDYTVVGTTVNIAARVENIADPNSILVTEAIIRFLHPAEFSQRGHFRLRGLDVDVPLFRIEQDQKSPANIEAAS
ncbi:MAG TPA: adenylate/guanylate cyclase domain-containing protein [Oligoflexus sp.]|uniref:adenylate/guanylate cyclase domain-containing protein n=1 Tax=Oligoflexus sp. TaxID=1971216 RepID=UPI002D806D22|nr:adenylate/guanylate cyclase domain-containing protein [Oligoflexus sp.]HET9238380.1 adenylate/guanylate cyclase domain-containing protein [Oligoflexus sp.]